MAPPWKDVVQSVSNDTRLKKTAPEVEQVAASWIAEARDLCLHMSSHVGTKIEAVVERKLKDDPTSRLKKQINAMVDNNQMALILRVPDCASDTEISADLARKTICCSMTIKAPGDRKSTKARLNWLLRMLPGDDERLLVRAHWPGRAGATARPLRELRDEPGLIQAENSELVPHSFEVLLVEGAGKRFAGRRTFIEDLERIVPEYYDLVGANLKAWQPAPPKPVKSRADSDPGELTESDLGAAGALPPESA